MIQHIPHPQMPSILVSSTFPRSSSLDFSSRHRLGLALRASRGFRKVHLVVNVVADLGWAGSQVSTKRASLVRSVRVQKWCGGCERAGWAAEYGAAESRGQFAHRPSNGASYILFRSRENERSDRLETLVQVAQDSLRREVRATELSNARDEGVLGIDGQEAISQRIHHAIWSGATVPVLGPLLWDIFELAGLGVVLGANDVGNRFVVRNTTCSVGTVGEEVGVESKGNDRYNLWERKCVQVWVVGLRELGIGSVLVGHGLHSELLLSSGSSKPDILLEYTGGEVVVVAAAEVEV
jgi:hypothetical protein